MMSSRCPRGNDNKANPHSPQPVTFGDGRVTAHRIVLVGEPNHEDDVERRGRVVKELGHDGFHSCVKN